MAKKAARTMIPLIWLDEQDQKLVNQLQEALWANSRQDAILMALRWACRRLEKHPTAYRRFQRDSDRAYADGKPITIRLTQAQRKYLDGFQKSTQAESLTEAVRILIRMAEAHFSGE